MFFGKKDSNKLIQLSQSIILNTLFNSIN